MREENTVTTGAPHAARDLGLDGHPVHAARYARAEEVLEVVTPLRDRHGPRPTNQYRPDNQQETA